MEALTLPLSLSQREVWLDQRAWPGSAHLNIGGGAFLEGPLDHAIFKAALQHLVAENEALRLVPHLQGDQRLLPSFEAPLAVVELGDAADPRQAMRDWWHTTIQNPFVLNTQPPWRFTLLRAHDSLHGLTIQFHHLIMDGWGTSHVMQRWSEIYNALATGQPVSPVVDPGYQRFIEESQAYRDSPAFERDGEYWLTCLPALQPMVLERRLAVPATGPEGARVSSGMPTAHLAALPLPRADYNQLNQWAVARGTSAFNVFLAALALYFSRVAATPTVVVGVPTLNRSGRRFRQTLGMFVGVLPVSITLVPGMTADALLGAVGQAMRGALRHARYPLSELGRKLDVLRQGREGLFDVLLSYERQDYAVSFGEAQLLDSRQLFSGKARYPLGVTVCEFHDDEDLELVLEGSSSCFTDSEVTPLGQRLWHVVQHMMRHPEQVVAELPLMPAAEQQRWIGPPDLAPAPPPFITQFEAWAVRQPDATALVWDGGQLSYAALNQRANQLAHRLHAFGAGRDQVVAMVMHRGADLLVSMLAVAKAGACFLPLDPDAPVARLADIVADSGAIALLIQQQSLERMAQLHPRTVVVDWQGEVPNDAATANAPPGPASEDLAYVLFTSGSTGKPKGVMLPHAALSLRLAWITQAYGIVPADRSAQGTQTTFDPSLIELFLPLINGASVAIPPPGRLLPETLADFAIRHGATFSAFVPSTLSRFLDRAGNHPDLKLRVACCGGEVLPADLVNRYLNQTAARLFNVYGPTEACIFATAWESRASPSGTALPIGFALDHTRIYVLDALQQLLPPGVAGEIYIGGGALARGYLNRPELTAQVFVPNPFHTGERLYRTGDRGWLDADGMLHFVGRLDRQIKLRGYRIELGEIEAALLGMEGVTQAAVKLVTVNDKPVIHAWVAIAFALAPEQLQRVLRVRLPDYMIPGGITVLPELPSSSVGKIDYAALQVQDHAFVPTVAARHPRSPLERELLALWQDVLDRRPLTVHDNFFDVGGDSLAAVGILASIERMTSTKVPLFLLTENPTVERLATALEGEGNVPGLLINFNPGSGHVPVYLAASGHGDLIRFQNLAHALEGSCDLRMMQPPLDQPIESMAALARLYADKIEAQGSGQCFVAGFSVGGITALETARLLRDRGVPVRALILIDTVFPKVVWGGTFYWRLLGWLVRHLRLQDLSMNGRRLGAMFNDPGLVGQVMSMAGYRVNRFDGRTLLIKTRGLARWDRSLFSGWRKLMPRGFTEHQIPGLHGSIFEATQVKELAAVITDTVRLHST